MTKIKIIAMSDMIDFLLKSEKENKTYQAIALELGCSRQRVEQIFKKLIGRAKLRGEFSETAKKNIRTAQAKRWTAENRALFAEMNRKIRYK
jgi:DNA-directed RNA polymerase sigma subunit (sigma70/sigma32)